MRARIARLQELLHSARVDAGDEKPQVVALGREAEGEYLRTGKVVTYRIAGVPEQSGTGTVSARSPVGAALIGRSPGEVVSVELPTGRVEEIRVRQVFDAARAA